MKKKRKMKKGAKIAVIVLVLLAVLAISGTAVYKYREMKTKQADKQQPNVQEPVDNATNENQESEVPEEPEEPKEEKPEENKTTETNKETNNSTSNNKGNSTTTQTPATEPNTNYNITTKVSINAVGDCTIGNDPDFGYANTYDYYYDTYGADYFLKNVRSIFESDDLTIANLETTFTDAPAVSGSSFNFKGPFEYVNVIANSSVEVVNLANNHIWDYKEKGYNDTVATLDKAGIKYFGLSNSIYHGNDYYYIYEKNDVKIGMTGIYCNETQMKSCTSDIDKAINYLNAQNVDTIILSFHWGIEAVFKYSAMQESMGHYAIDHGAELVLGHHPHRIQGIEVYKGKYIVYSLANFTFGGHKGPSDMDSFIFHIDLNYDGKKVVRSDVKIIPVKISSSGTKWNNFQPLVLTGSEKTRVLNKIQKYSKNVTLSA